MDDSERWSDAEEEPADAAPSSAAAMAAAEAEEGVRNLRVMTFNTWRTGSEVNDGLAKIVRHVQHVNPDVLFVQEIMDKEGFERLHARLGKAMWQACLPDRYRNIPGNGILVRKMQLDPQSICTVDAGQGPAIGVRALWPADPSAPGGGRHDAHLSLWCVHLDWRNYGPEVVFFGDKSHGCYNVVRGECNPQDPHECRVGQMRRILNSHVFSDSLKRANHNPMLLAGDFNCPSHLDWVAGTRMHHDHMEVEWPTTRMLADAGMVDSYRAVHRSAAADPGNTYSPVHKYHEETGKHYPQDRIDFVFHKSARLRPYKAQVYCGGATAGGHGSGKCRPIPRHKENDWPSDHAAVVVDYKLYPPPPESEPAAEESRREARTALRCNLL